MPNLCANRETPIHIAPERGKFARTVGNGQLCITGGLPNREFDTWMHEAERLSRGFLCFPLYRQTAVR